MLENKLPTGLQRANGRWKLAAAGSVRS